MLLFNILLILDKIIFLFLYGEVYIFKYSFLNLIVLDK